MTIIDNGVQGNKRQSTKPNPMPIVISIVEDQRKGTDLFGSKLAREFRDRVESDPNSEELIDIVWEYYWANAVQRCTKEAPTLEQRNAKRTARAAAVERVKAEVRSKIDAKAKRMYLEMLMPNGKQLRDCTREQLASMEPERVTIMQGLLKRLKPRQKPSALFATNEELVAALLDR